MTHTKLQKIFLSTITDAAMRNMWKKNLSNANREFAYNKRRAMKQQNDKD